MDIFKSYFKSITIVLLALFFIGCKKENACDCIKRTGDIITETRSISGFDKILVEDNLNVFITQDSVFEIKVEAGENIVPLIKTEVQPDGTLTIRNKNRCNWTRSYKKPFNVYIRMPVIKFITSNGSGSIKSENTITTPEFRVEVQSTGSVELDVNNSQVVTYMIGYGDLTLHGITHNHSCTVGGNGFLYCSDLVTNYTYLHAYTNGLCYINVTGMLDCIIDSECNVYCYGNPGTVQKKQNGEGQLYLQ